MNEASESSENIDPEFEAAVTANLDILTKVLTPYEPQAEKDWNDLRNYKLAVVNMGTKPNSSDPSVIEENLRIIYETKSGKILIPESVEKDGQYSLMHIPFLKSGETSSVDQISGKWTSTPGNYKFQLFMEGANERELVSAIKTFVLGGQISEDPVKNAGNLRVPQRISLAEYNSQGYSAVFPGADWGSPLFGEDPSGDRVFLESLRRFNDKFAPQNSYNDLFRPLNS